jgi:hypothetical protein
VFLFFLATRFGTFEIFGSTLVMALLLLIPVMVLVGGALLYVEEASFKRVLAHAAEDKARSEVEKSDRAAEIIFQSMSSCAGRVASYDDVLRRLVQAGRFGHEDVTGLPRTEIDFPTDVERAIHEVLPAIAAIRA